MTQTITVEACTMCGKLFQATNKQSVCPHCEAVIAKRFAIVKRYIRANPDSGLNEVSQECDIPVKQIIKWVREERLSFKQGSQVALPCMKCGTLISSGEYCPDCKRKISNQFTSAYSELRANKEAENGETLIHIKRNQRLRFSS